MRPEDLNPVTYFWKLMRLSGKALDNQEEQLAKAYHKEALYLRKMYPHVEEAWQVVRAKALAKIA